MERLLTVRDLAEILNVPVSWVYARTAKGSPEVIPHIRMGKYIRFDESEVSEYLRGRKAGNRG